MAPPSSRRRRLIGHGLAGVPLLVTAVRHPVLAAVPQTASAYGSVLASAQAGPQLQLYSNPFALREAVDEVRSAMEAYSRSKAGSSAGLLSKLVSGLLNALLGAVSALFSGTLTVSQLKTEQPDLYTFLVNYRSKRWPVSPAATFSSAIGQLQNYGPMALLDVAIDGNGALGQYFVAAYLNAASGGTIEPTLLSAEKVRVIAFELTARGYFEPTAGVRWDSSKVVEWWRLSLGLSL